MAGNVISRLSKSFALRVIALYGWLRDDKREFVMSKQLLRSGTSIGANIAESVYAQSTADYVSKLNIALKEANETKYWLELLKESGYISDTQFEELNNDVKTIIGTLINILKKVRE